MKRCCDRRNVAARIEILGKEKGTFCFFFDQLLLGESAKKQNVPFSHVGDPDAQEVATNAMLTAKNRQRASMVQFAKTALEPLELIWGEVGTVPVGSSQTKWVKLDEVRARLEFLLQQFEEMQRVSLLNARRAMKRENLKAVEQGDDKFFRYRYPDFPLWANERNLSI